MASFITAITANTVRLVGLEGILRITESSFLIFLGTENHGGVGICPVSYLGAEQKLMRQCLQHVWEHRHSVLTKRRERRAPFLFQFVIMTNNYNAQTRGDLIWHLFLKRNPPTNVDIWVQMSLPLPLKIQ